MAAMSTKRRPETKHFNSNPINTPMVSSKSSHFLRRKLSTLPLAFLFVSVLVLLGISSIMWSKLEFHSPKLYSGEVINEFPHDPQAFTQGLLYGGNDTLFESTGLLGKSSVRKVDLQTGKVQLIQRMDDSEFGEGLTLFGERLFQVTWLNTTGFIYDRNNLSKVQKFTHQMQDGWGLATDGNVLFGSDGSSTLYQIDAKTLKVIGRQIVRYKGHEVHNLNELEFINGEVWANVWQTDCIARISHKDGLVLAWILLPNLREKLVVAGNRDIDVLNGIAWDGEKNRLFVTGKLWPKLYEIKLHPIKKELNDGVVQQLCLRKPFHFGR